MARPTTRTDFLNLLKKSGICPSRTFSDLAARSDQLPNDPSLLAADLVRKNVLTQFQAKLLLAGRHKGFKLGSYLIRGHIGQGGAGTVYLAEHLTLRRPVALKVLAVKEGTNRGSIERFLREARAAAALDHPNIVRIFDIGQQGPVHYLAMEFIEGNTLDSLIRKNGPFPWQRAVECVLQAAAGLQHAHEKGFIHRDIKPTNLIWAKDGTVKILDMGLARSLEPSDKLTELLADGAVLGTADYIAPEQAMNNPDLDIRADIYSLGATFFALLTGRPPFQGTTAQKLIQHQMTLAAPVEGFEKSIPPGLSKIVAKMLAKKPAQRYSTPAAVIAVLQPWLAGPPAETTEDTEVELSEPEDEPQVVLAVKRRSRLPFLIGGMLIILLILTALVVGLVIGM